MALMVGLSTISWTVEKHLCMGKVVGISLFTKAQNCGAKDTRVKKYDQKFQNSCCAEESFTLKGQDKLKPSWNELDLQSQHFLVVFAQSYCNLFTPLEQYPLPYSHYSPPTVIQDIQLLDEVFLI